MGMFDYVTCDYPLPWPEVAGIAWQSNDTDAQYVDYYEIRADGTLWHEGRKHWKQVPHEGEIEIHHWEPDVGSYSVKFWFRDGVVKDVITSFTKVSP